MPTEPNTLENPESDGGAARVGRTLLASGPRRQALRAGAAEWPSWTVAGGDLADLEALVAGYLWPLRGYTADRANVDATGEATGRHLELSLVVTPAVGREATPGSRLALRDPEGVLLAVLEVQHREEHRAGWRLAGPVEGVELPSHEDFRHLRLAPAEIATRLRALGRKHVLACWPGRLLHAGTRAALVASARRLDASLLVLIGTSGSEHDELHDVPRVHALTVSASKLPDERTVVAVVPMSPPTSPAHLRRERLVAANCGATHVGIEADRPDDAPPQSSEAPLADAAPVLVPVQSWAYSPRTQSLLAMASSDDPDLVATPPVEEILSRDAGDLPSWLFDRDEVDALRRAYVPRDRQGFTVFLTGLSGSGKSTIARTLRLRLMEQTGRQVTLLDGDRVRRVLSSELGFSREHRDLNILRIGWVASEITRHGGIAICAPIAPYEAIRRQVRTMVQAAGGFVLVHVSTPLEVCEARDRKGLYAKARAGLLQHFTGISDPYETPEDAEVTIDTRDTAVDEACDTVMAWLLQRGYLAGQ
jgi:sulfate adenylyltransferase